MNGFNQIRFKRPLALALLTASLATLTTTSVAAYAPAAGTASSSASTAGPVVNIDADVQRGFNSLDTNSDGRISRDEAIVDTVLSRDFNKYDLNRDGMISAAEFARFAAIMNASEARQKNGSE